MWMAMVKRLEICILYPPLFCICIIQECGIKINQIKRCLRI